MLKSPHWKNKLMMRLYFKGDSKLQAALLEPSSLTQYIESKCNGHFHIKLKSAGLDLLSIDEAISLKLSNRIMVFVREVWLMSDEHRLVYARTIIPQCTLRLRYRQFIRLGSQPLGQVLFDDQNISRSEMSYAKLYKKDFRKFIQLPSQDWQNDDYIWLRRSLFHIKDKPLLLTEFFLPIMRLCL